KVAKKQHQFLEPRGRRAGSKQIRLSPPQERPPGATACLVRTMTTRVVMVALSWWREYKHTRNPIATSTRSEVKVATEVPRRWPANERSRCVVKEFAKLALRFRRGAARCWCCGGVGGCRRLNPARFEL